MIPRTCIVKHDPPNSYGDCLRACIASLCDDDSVPHFVDDGDDERGQQRLRAYLASRGLNPFYMALPGNLPLASIFEMMAGVNIGVEYLLFHTSHDADHVVICRDDKVIHDPAWYRSPITGPSSNGLWVVMVVVPIAP